MVRHPVTAALWCLLLGAALVGCGFSFDPGLIPCDGDGTCPTGYECAASGFCGAADDDDAGDDDDDDDTTGDDDDSSADDDDTTGDDDDATSPDLRVWAVLAETEILGPGSTSLGFSSAAIASFSSGEPLLFGDPSGWDGLPMPGAGLHPEQFAGDEGCELLSSSEPLDPIPASDPVGGVVNLIPSAPAPTLELQGAVGLYSFEATEALASPIYSIGVKGGLDWPQTTLDEVLALPPRATGFLLEPGGVISNISVIEFRWDGLGDPGGVEVSMLRWTTANQESWAAVRCHGPDDGTLFVDASSLAAGNGDIIVIVSRAAWVTDGVQASGADVQAHLGAIRSVAYTLTPTGR